MSLFLSSPAQTIELNQDLQGLLEYPVKCVLMELVHLVLMGLVL